jgi:hypothetical protein
MVHKKNNRHCWKRPVFRPLICRRMWDKLYVVDTPSFRRAAFSAQLKSKVGLTLDKVTALRITLNLDGSPITSKSHTHPSYSQTSRLLTSSLPRYSSSSSNPVYPRHVDSSSLGFSLSINSTPDKSISQYVGVPKFIPWQHLWRPPKKKKK